jgi:hypothetical protein
MIDLQRSMRRRAINRVGRRTNDWRRAWRFLKPRLEARGRTHCEFSFIPHECGGGLTPAHSKKRRLMEGDDIYAVAIACRAVHGILDGVIPNPSIGRRMNHEDMERAVLFAIERAGGLILPETS